MTTINREYDYKPSWFSIFFNAIFFGACAAFLGTVAAFNDRGRVFFGIINLSPDSATIFYWVLCSLSIGFVAICALLAFHRLMHPQRIAFTSEAIILPKSRWSSTETAINYNDIASLSGTKVSGQRFLLVFRADGRRFTIAASHLPTRDSFDELCDTLQANLNQARRNST